MSFRTTTADQKFPKAAFWASLLVGAVVAMTGPARAADADIDTETSSIAQPFAAVRMIAFSAPVEGYSVNSRFGLRRLSYERRARMHEGLDFAAPSGTPVLSAAEGEVLRTGTSPSYGRYVEVRHDNGVTSFYAHLSAIVVAEGDRLQAGERLGSVGSTGRSTGPHLHFEIRRDGEQINPEDFLGQAFAALNVAPGATDGGHAHEGFFDAAPVAYAPFRTLMPAGHP
ncbi:M23 family metallopeptidase [Brevundimonas sp.]|uniref:M23 family metallopeptidase n=1 Tax=Brevundimonas sp. TaxID=1871086 RepID=UPI0025CD2896|nr:M23 family metallopeptidase [Brevundimonas sp.]